MRHHIGLVLVVALALGCSGKKDIPEETAPEPSPDVARVKRSSSPWVASCRALSRRVRDCHSISGKGDGAQAKGMMPRPRNFTDAGWQPK